MSLRRRELLSGTLGLGALSACGRGPGPWPTTSGLRALASVELPPHHAPPPNPREFRAAWVASVAHIDWPRQSGLSAAMLAQQIEETVQRAHQIGLNALLLQVRPATDALYRSELEPPSEYLHAQGQPGESFDALALWLQACHARGIELHAWFNPYRARHPSAKAPVHERHLSRTRPELVARYGDLLWLDPGQPDAQRHSLDVITDVVRRYDIDGVHLDDYFYPYPIKAPDGTELPFPDEASYGRYRARGGTASLADWRRENVNRLVAELYERVHRIQPHVRVSISPFGIGRPDRRPAGIGGFSQYDQIYADVERWCEQGWLDALLPQLYWPRSRPQQSYEKLLDYWLGVNPHRRHLWPGLFTSSVGNGTPAAWDAAEVLWQIDRQRERPAATGHAHFSLIALLQDRGGIASELQRTRYATPALSPASEWLARGEPAPSAVEALQRPDGRVALTCTDGRAAWQWAVWRRPHQRAGSASTAGVGPTVSGTLGGWRFEVLGASSTQQINASGDEVFVVQAIDRLGREGPRRAFAVSA